MKPERMNAFSDGVLAILITILVLELRPPEGHHLSDVLDEKGKLLAYLLSFVMVGIYWNNHHHLMSIVDKIDGRTLWANMHLLFWLSLISVGTAWLGEAGVETGPVAAYA
ncbi:MAG: potassium channel family protein, partial [Gaiellales bacterium]|nr:potassium channel family protein [Gaiellales bacterium]